MVTIAGRVTKKGTLDVISIPFLNYGHPVPIQLTFSNDGNVHLGTQGALTIRNWLGRRVKTIPVPEAYVIPDSRKTINVAMVGGGIVGFYKTDFSLQEASIAKPAKPTYFIVFPWTLALGIAFIALSIFFMGKRQGRKAVQTGQSTG